MTAASSLFKQEPCIARVVKTLFSISIQINGVNKHSCVKINAFDIFVVVLLFFPFDCISLVSGRVYTTKKCTQVITTHCQKEGARIQIQSEGSKSPLPRARAVTMWQPTTMRVKFCSLHADALNLAISQEKEFCSSLRWKLNHISL